MTFDTGIKDLKSAIAQELKWCKQSPDKAPSKEFLDGFMAGLRQVRDNLIPGLKRAQAVSHSDELQTHVVDTVQAMMQKLEVKGFIDSDLGEFERRDIEEDLEEILLETIKHFQQGPLSTAESHLN